MPPIVSMSVQVGQKLAKIPDNKLDNRYFMDYIRNNCNTHLKSLPGETVISKGRREDGFGALRDKHLRQTAR